MKYKDENGVWKNISVKVADTIEIGTIVLFGGTNAPSGWLMCDGSAISRTTYSKLFDAIGTSFGEGDGSTTFNLPNYKGKVPVGLDPNDEDFNTLGKTGGSKTSKVDADGKRNSDTGTEWAHQGLDTTSRIFSIVQPYLVSNYIIKAENSVANALVNENIYSENEVIIGYVVKNGKEIPVYRKMINGLLSEINTRQQIIFDGEIVDELFDYFGNINYGDFRLVIGKSSISNYNMTRIVQAGNNIRIDFTNSEDNCQFRAFIIYTKTTDL